MIKWHLVFPQTAGKFGAQTQGFDLNRTSGVLTIFPSDHISAPYTLISCWVSIWSALFSTTLQINQQKRNMLICVKDRVADI